MASDKPIQTSRPVRAAANVLLLIISLSATLVLAELSLRLGGYPPPIKINGPSYTPRFYYKAEVENGFDIADNFPDGVFGFPGHINTFGSPFTVSSNNIGCRDRPFEREDGYVLLLGDSFAWGYVPAGQTLGAILEQLVGMRVLKCGVPGYGTRQERHKLDIVVKRAGQPRVVIVGYTVGNDLLDDYLHPARKVIDGYLVTASALSDEKLGLKKLYSDEEIQGRLRSVLGQQPVHMTHRVKNTFADHSVLYELLRNSVALRRLAAHFGLAEAPPPPAGVEVFHTIADFPWLAQAWNDHLTNMRQLNAAVEATGATMLLVIFPTNAQIYESLRPKQGNLQWEYPNQRLTSFLQREHIAFVDLMPEFRRHARGEERSKANPVGDLYWPNDGHPNALGNRLAALVIADSLLRHSLLPQAHVDTRLSAVRKSIDELISGKEAKLALVSVN